LTHFGVIVVSLQSIFNQNEFKMKKIKLFLITLFIPFFSIAQGGIELVPFAGYMFGGHVNFYEGKYKVTDGVDYGLSILVPLQSVVELEINYTRMQSEGRFTAYSGYPGYTDKQTDMSTNYFQIGTLKSFTNNSHIAPFGSVSVGATWFNFADYDDRVLFSAVLGLGVKFMFTDRVGIMLRGRLMMPMFFGSVGFYAGTGGGGLTLNSYAAIVQGDFNGGLVIKLGN